MESSPYYVNVTLCKYSEIFVTYKAKVSPEGNFPLSIPKEHFYIFLKVPKQLSVTRNSYS